MPLYALAATVGSVIGSTGLYLAARRGGVRALKGFKPETRARVEGLLGRYDMLAIMVPGVLPPPFPFKVFILSAGAFRLRLPRFLIAIFIGRAARFLIEGFLAVEFGSDALALFRQQGIKAIVAVACLGLIVMGVKYYRMRTKPAPVLAVDEAAQTGE
jgi:membrane protein DedA with SNARE-associated domain